MRIVLIGAGRLAASLLENLLESEHEVVAVVQDGRRTARWARPWALWMARLFGGKVSVNRLAQHRRIPIYWINRMDERELAPLRRLEPDLILVGGFSIILKAPLLNLPRIGCVNVHSSLLPRHRGPNPFAAVILAGETETGVTFHGMEETIDTGPILHQVRFPVKSDASVLGIYHEACELAGGAVNDVMDTVARDGVVGEPQDPSLATYEKKLTPSQVRIDWSRPAVEIERLIRACTPAPIPWTHFAGRQILIPRAWCDDEPFDAPPGTLLATRPNIAVATGRGRLCFRFGLCRTPIPWVWPSPWNKALPGEQFEYGNGEMGKSEFPKERV